MTLSKPNSPLVQTSDPEIKPTSNKVTLVIENIVISIDLKVPLDLDYLLSHYRDVEHRVNFPGLITKLSYPKATVLFFKSGKVVGTGIQKPRSVQKVVDKVIKRLESAGLEIPANPDVKIGNIVVKGDFHKTIDLDMASIILESSVYEPEVFPGLVYKRYDPNICFLVFSSGRIIVTGANSEALIKQEVKRLAILLKKSGVLDSSPKKQEPKEIEFLDLA